MQDLSDKKSNIFKVIHKKLKLKTKIEGSNPK